MVMKSPGQIWNLFRSKLKKEWKAAFWSALVLGLLIHMPVMLKDIPNHDGLASMYFDQNMITSGRWFLTVACGFSSYFTLPWLIGLLGILYLSLVAAVIAEVLEIKHTGTAVLIGGLLVSFPALVSTFAYVFTLDGYMLGLLLAVCAVLCVKKYRLGFLPGGICLAFSMGIYQAYLPFAILLSLYSIVLLFLNAGQIKDKAKGVLAYGGMGVLGVALYYILLQLLLWVQGKELASYQGISGMGSLGGGDFFGTLKGIYADFLTFTLKGHVLFNNVFSIAGILVLAGLLLYTFFKLAAGRKLWKSPWLYLTCLALLVILPVGASVICIISPEVNYHLLMRYQWVLFLIFGAGFTDRYIEEKDGIYPLSRWLLIASAGVMVFNYAVTDNIAYSNLEKRYEKTYAYCLRLLDRMEQAEGYYKGIPVAMIGVVGDEQFPLTDITTEVTGSMIGIPGDSLLYTAANYQAFMKHYLGAEIELIDAALMPEIYDSAQYREMDSFPGKNSVRVVDGILYIKTENRH